MYVMKNVGKYRDSKVQLVEACGNSRFAVVEEGFTIAIL